MAERGPRVAPACCRFEGPGDGALVVSLLEHLERRGDLDRSADRAIHRAARHVVVERALDLLAVGLRVEAEVIPDVDPLDHEHAVVEFDLAGRLARQASFCCGNLTRFQRASEGPRQSACGGRDDVVQGRRALRLAAARDPVVVGDLVMDAEVDRLGRARHLRPPKRTSYAFDANAGDVHDLRSRQLLCVLSPGRARPSLPGRAKTSRRRS